MNSQLVGLKQTLTTPLIADLMESRAIGLATLAAVGIHGGLVAAGLPGWQCPFRHVLGVPCPGCGLSRAIEALFRGDWDTALAYHAFAPLVLLALMMIIGASLLPRRPRRRLIEFLAGLERRLGVGTIGLMAMVVYWLARLVFFSESYLALIMN